MTSPERLFGLYSAVQYVVARGLPGDFVECGVWRGGSTIAAALAFDEAGGDQRHFWLYDTFEGMSAPTAFDVDHRGIAASNRLSTAKQRNHHSNIWCISPLNEVKENLLNTVGSLDQFKFIVGKVEDTIPSRAPEEISILRLDTDWYELTLHELTHLFPRLVPGGVLILDDYGYWQGARKAVDEYLASHGALMLARLDDTGRLAVKA